MLRWGRSKLREPKGSLEVTVSQTQMITCEFCETLNPAGRETCLACGAPLPKKTNPPAGLDRIVYSAPHPEASQSDSAVAANNQMQQEREDGEKVEEIGRKALYAYSLLWRTLAEAAAVAMTGIGLGVIGGVTGSSGLAVPGAVLVGIGVGFAIKIPLLALFSAPVGLLAGVLVGAVLYVLTDILALIPVCASLCAFLAAIIGGSNIRRVEANLYERLRPFIGSAGGLVFGLLGMLLGLALRAAANALLTHSGS